jgi:hypothetical protein
MYWANFLHIYQPFGQSRTILNAVVNQSYRRIFEGLARLKTFKLTLNINAALSELLLEYGYKDVIDAIRNLAESGRLEFTESAKHHALLPFLPKEEIKRQIILNHKTNRKIFGPSYAPKCFFPPEMAYSKSVAEAARELGYSIILVDEIAFPQDASSIQGSSRFEKIFSIRGVPGIIPLFRERRISNLIMSAVVRDLKTFRQALGKEAKKSRYLLTAMDGETFGHHRPGLEAFLLKLIASTSHQQIFVSEIPERFESANIELDLRESTWASSEADIAEGVQFYSWKNPKNKVHSLQWQFFKLVLRHAPPPQKRGKTEWIDRSLASDHFFWASMEPWWSIEMIERGAWLLLEALNRSQTSKTIRKKGLELYHRILEEAYALQRKGIIEERMEKYRETIRIPFRERTLEAGKPEVYEAVIFMMKKKMKEAAKRNEFEKAILWRDAIWKLETKNDIYDTVHAVDLLRQELPHGALERLMDAYKKKYQRLQPGQPEQRRIKNKA